MMITGLHTAYLLVSLGVHHALRNVHIAVVLLVSAGHHHGAPHVETPRLVEPVVENLREEEIFLVISADFSAQLEQRPRLHLDLKERTGVISH